MILTVQLNHYAQLPYYVNLKKGMRSGTQFRCTSKCLYDLGSVLSGFSECMSETCFIDTKTKPCNLQSKLNDAKEWFH